MNLFGQHSVLELDSYTEKQISGILQVFQQRTGYKPDLGDPKTLNEKILWRKLNDRRSLLVTLTDKVEAKKWILGRSEIEAIPDLEESDIQYPFILKPNTNSGKSQLVRNTEEYGKALVVMERCRRTPYGQSKGEWAYAHVEFQTLYEPLLTDVVDLKLYCFHGRVEVICIPTPSAKLKAVESKGNSFFDRSGQLLPFRIAKWPPGLSEVPPEIDLERVVRQAERLVDGLDFVRLDLLHTLTALYLGEFTWYPGAGHTVFAPREYDRKLGELWSL